MNLFDDKDRADLLLRIQAFEAGATRRWGTLTPAPALAHMGRQIQLALGELEAKPIRLSPLRYLGLNYLAIHWMPWPRGIRAPPVFLDPTAEDVAAEQQRLIDLIEAAVARGQEGEWAAHPLFGSLPGRTWGVLMARHLDHHLRQFSL